MVNDLIKLEITSFLSFMTTTNRGGKSIDQRGKAEGKSSREKKETSYPVQTLMRERFPDIQR
jgi:hypothetical protein